eukprot:UN31905
MNFELKQKDRPSQVNTILTKPKPYPVFNLMTNDMRTDLSNCVEDDICVSDVPHIMDIMNIKRCPIQLNDVCPCSCSVLIDMPIVLQSIQSENIPDVCSHSLYRLGKWKGHNPGSHK